MAIRPSNGARWRICARLIDRILKGANPADLPVEMNDVYDFALNLSTARKDRRDVPREHPSSGDRVHPMSTSRDDAPRIHRRTLLRHTAAAIAAAALWSCGGGVSTSTKRVPRIGTLSMLPSPSGNAAAFLAGLKELGYEDGKNIEVHPRWNNEVDPDVRGASCLAAIDKWIPR